MLTSCLGVFLESYFVDVLFDLGQLRDRRTSSYLESVRASHSRQCGNFVERLAEVDDIRRVSNDDSHCKGVTAPNARGLHSQQAL